MRHEKLAHPEWSAIPEPDSKRHGFWPNTVYFTRDLSKVVIVLRESDTRAFAINERTVEKHREYASNCRVRLVDQDREIVCETNLGTVINNLVGHEVNVGKYGNYFWLDNSFRVCELRRRQDVVDEIEEERPTKKRMIPNYR
jgi:hypothetical protein